MATYLNDLGRGLVAILVVLWIVATEFAVLKVQRAAGSMSPPLWLSVVTTLVIIGAVIVLAVN